jgi:hypothetical protein
MTYKRRKLIPASQNRKPRLNPRYPQFKPGVRIEGTYFTVGEVYGPRMALRCACGWWIAISCCKMAGKHKPLHCNMCRASRASSAA